MDLVTSPEPRPRDTGDRNAAAVRVVAETLLDVSAEYGFRRPGEPANVDGTALGRDASAIVAAMRDAGLLAGSALTGRAETVTVIALIVKLAAALLRHGNCSVLVACSGPGPTTASGVDVGDQHDGATVVVVHDGSWT